MQVLPVIDLLDGVVVRGVAGQRDKYQPVSSQIAPSPDALSVAHAFRDELGLSEIYLADLDAIIHQRPNTLIYRSLASAGFDLLIDAGLRDIQTARDLFDHGARAVIAGLETSTGPDQVEQLLGEFGPERIIFSLDMQSGRPLGALEPWATDNPMEIASRVISFGIDRLIVLDLEQVGARAGVSTLPLCRRLLVRKPSLRIITGGGIRGLSDLQTLAHEHIDSVLVASALHNATIGRDELRQLHASCTMPLESSGE